MKSRTMKVVGIIIMVLSYPLGYLFWNFVCGRFIVNSTWYLNEQAPILLGVGIMEFYLVGLGLFVTGIILKNLNK